MGLVSFRQVMAASRRRALPTWLALASTGIVGIPATAQTTAQHSTQTMPRAWDLSDKLVSRDPTIDAEFGGAVSIDGDTLIAGAYRADGFVQSTGAAYVFDRAASGDWQFNIKLTGAQSNAFEWFGESVDLDGDRAIVGAPYHDGVQGSSGGAYVFERDGNGLWSQTGRLIAPDGEQDDQFGWSVSISDDLAAVGCPQDSNYSFWSGSVYMFERNGNGSWSYLTTIRAGTEHDYACFGTSVALEGNRLIAGAPKDNSAAYNGGAVYVIERDGTGNWNELCMLLAEPVSVSSEFGAAVALSGERIVVGSPNDDTVATNAGAAYVFTRQWNGTWTRSAKLTAADGAFNDQLGISVAISGNCVAAGAHWDGDHGSNSGSAYVFTASHVTGAWAQAQKITAFDGDVGDWYGDSIALGGVTLVVGSPNDDDHVNRSGSAYVYSRHSR